MPHDEDIKKNQNVAYLSYIWILFFVPLFLKRDSKFCQFHAKQGLILFIAELFWWIPLLGWLVGLLALVLSIAGLYQVYNGKYWEMPIVSDLAKKLNI